jgi:hypothetical protein
VVEPPIDTDYILLLNRAGSGHLRISKIWPIAINEPLPTIPIPLHLPDPDVPLDLASVFANIYATNYYEYRLDYSRPVPLPELRPLIKTWLAE